MIDNSARHAVRPIEADRLHLFFGVLAWCCVFPAFYYFSLFPIYGKNYVYKFDPPTMSEWGLIAVLALLPTVWCPSRVTRPSMVLYLFLYVLGYIPFCFVSFFIRRASLTLPDPSLTCWVLCLAMLLIHLVYRLPVPNVILLAVSQRTFWRCLVGFSVLSLVTLVVVFRGNMSISDPLNPGIQRQLGGEIVSSGPIPGLGYVTNVLDRVAVPVLLVWGLWNRRWQFVWLALACESVLYCARAARAGMAWTVVALFVCCLVKRRPGVNIAVLCIWLLVFVTGVFTCSEQLLPESVATNLRVFLMRLTAIPAAVTDHHITYFSTEPQTYFSHLKGFSLFSKNPYDLGLGYEVGHVLTKDWANNLNVGFWGDGFSGMGYIGLICESLVVAGVFWLMDGTLRQRAHAGTFIIVSQMCIPFMNGSIFTNLLGGGLALLIVVTALLDWPGDVQQLSLGPGSSFEDRPTP